MKAQSLGSQALDQDSADAEPQRITAGQHYRTLITPEGQQLFAQSDWMITGDATLVWFRGAPLLQGRQHPFWGCQQMGLLHQKLSSGWERAGSTGVGADHIDHHAIVQPSTQAALIPIVHESSKQRMVVEASCELMASTKNSG